MRPNGSIAQVCKPTHQTWSTGFISTACELRMVCAFYFFKFIFIYFWLCWVFIAVASLVAEHGL